MNFKILTLFVTAFVGSISYADRLADGNDPPAVSTVEEKTEIAKLKECAWKMKYSLRRKEEDKNFKDPRIVLLRWPPTEESRSKAMFLNDKGFIIGLKNRNDPSGVYPTGRRLDGKREIDVAIKITKHQITSSMSGLKSMLQSSISSRYHSLDRILKEKDVDDIREGLCTCEKYKIGIEEIKKGRLELFTQEPKRLFRVQTKTVLRPLRIEDVSCPEFAGS